MNFNKNKLKIFSKCVINICPDGFFYFFSACDILEKDTRLQVHL